MSRPHETGFGKPPAHTRFKRGQSGNPSGRPKGAARLDSIIKAELEGTVRITIDGKCREISRREAMVRRTFAKALRGDIRAAEIFLKHLRKREPPEPQHPYIIKYYKDDKRRSQVTQDGKETVDNKEAESSSDGHGTSTASQRDVVRDPARSESSANEQASRNDQVVAHRNDGASSSCAGGTGAETAPHAARNTTNGEASSSGTTIRMRTPQPFQNFFVSPVDDSSGRYSSGADGIIDNVHRDHLVALLRLGCVRA